MFHGKRGELWQRYDEGQEDQLGALGFVVNVTVVWNTIYKLRPLLPRIDDPDCRAQATAVLDRYEKVIRQRSPIFRTQVVHNDFNPSNVLIDPDDPARITGVLDFGDMVETALIHDLAVAAAYQVEGADPLVRPLALARGYHAASPLLPVEVDSLFDLIALRHVLTMTIGESRASLHPENRAYVLRHQPRAAAALASLAEIGPVEGRGRSGKPARWSDAHDPPRHDQRL